MSQIRFDSRKKAQKAQKGFQLRENQLPSFFALLCGRPFQKSCRKKAQKAQRVFQIHTHYTTKFKKS
jgi:hypothetical protein